MAQRVEKPHCQVCARPVPARVNRFCSRDCWHLSRRAAWPLCQREGCTTRVKRSVRRFCSHACEVVGRYGAPLPTCKAEGCTKRVGKRSRLYCSKACAPGYATECRKLAMYKHRRQRFGRVIDEMIRHGHRLTREQLVDLCARVYDEGYSAGYQARSRQIRRAA